jgi:hypothetical protein
MSKRSSRRINRTIAAATEIHKLNIQRQAADELLAKGIDVAKLPDEAIKVQEQMLELWHILDYQAPYMKDEDRQFVVSRLEKIKSDFDVALAKSKSLRRSNFIFI